MGILVLLTIAGPGGIAARGHIKELQSTLTQVFFFFLARPLPCPWCDQLSPRSKPQSLSFPFLEYLLREKNVLYETVLLRVAAASAGHPDCLILMQTHSFGG